MSCSPGVVSPGPRVDSPGVWSRFARSMKSFRPRVENKSFSIGNIWESPVKFKIFSDRWMDGCQTNPVDQCAKQSSWLVDESRWRLKSDDSSIDPSTGTKHRASDYSLLRKLPYRNIGHNLYQANRLSPGETTSDSGRIDSGSGRNDSGRTGHRSKRP